MNFKSYQFGDDQIETVENYTYLGVVFSDNCEFLENAKIVIDKTNIAVGTTLSTIYKSKAFSWSTVSKLYENLITSILMYNIFVWGLEYLELLEKSYLLFFKWFLMLPKNTPNYAIRLETEIPPLKLGIFKHILNWSNKLLEMNDSRYPNP